MRSPSAMSNRSVGYLPGPQEPEIQTIKLHKSNNGMGLSIVAAKVRNVVISLKLLHAGALLKRCFSLYGSLA